MNVLILGQFKDKQSGIYILESFGKTCSKVDGIDIRELVIQHGVKDGQAAILKTLTDLNLKLDLIVMLKGLELSHETVEKVKELYTKAKLVNCIFNKYWRKDPIWETEDAFKTIKLFDYFFCSLKGVADKLTEKGLKNARYLDEGCQPTANKEIYMNYFQERKYGEDISFVGSLGYLMQHQNRIPTLLRIIREGFRAKIWGDVVCEWKRIPQEIKQFHMQTQVINEDHSKAVQSSLINLGIDQDTDIDMGHSARIFRVLCAGGFYLCNATKGLEKIFKINKEGKPITSDQEIAVYYNLDDLIDKIDFLLEHGSIRRQIAKNGQKRTLENYTFEHRVKELLKVVNDGRN